MSRRVLCSGARHEQDSVASGGDRVASVAVAAFVAWAGGQDGTTVSGWPVLWLCALLAFVINWAAFVPCYVFRTEHYYDLTGSVSYLALVGFAKLQTGQAGQRAILLGSLVAVWALRLGAFLFARVRRAGSDERFDEIKNDAGQFLTAWTLQGLWVFLTLCCALSAMTATETTPLVGRKGMNDLLGYPFPRRAAPSGCW